MKRLHEGLLIGSFLPSCWLAMQAVHELEHVVGAVATGGRVERDCHLRIQDIEKPCGMGFSRSYVDCGLAENLAEKDDRRVPNRAGDCRSPIREKPLKFRENGVLTT